MFDLGFPKSLFSKNKKTPESLSAGAHLDAISDETYASDVRKMILEEEPGGRTMTVIAYETLKVIYAYSVKLKSEGKYPEFSLESLIASTIEQGKKAKSQNDEINWRRFTWFATAASVMRLDWAVIKRHPELVQVGAEIWLALASSGAHIVPLTKDSAIWTDEEKFRYSGLSDAGDGIAHVLNFVVPERYLRMTEFQTFAEQNNMFIVKHSESRPSAFKKTNVLPVGPNCR
jgi:hypothetical protein